MPPETNPNSDQLRQLIATSLNRAQSYTGTLHRTHAALVFAGLFTSALSTLIAGGAAVQGPLLGPGPGGWQLTCGLASLLAFISTICLGIEQQLKLGERLPVGRISVGRLRALDMALTTGSREWGEIAKEFEVIMKESAEIFS